MAGKMPAYTQQYVDARKPKLTNKYGYFFTPLLLILADYAAVLCAEEMSFVLRNYFSRSQDVLYISKFHFYVIAPFIYFVYLHLFELYSRKMQFWRIIAGIFKANLYAILTGIFVLYIVQRIFTNSRLYMAFLCFFAFFFIVLFRFVLKNLFGRLHLFEEPVLLMGAGLTAQILLHHIKEDIGLSYRFIGYLEDNVPNAEVAAQLPRLGKFTDAADVIRKTGVKNVLVIAPGLEPRRMQDLVYEIQPLVSNVGFIPDMGTMPLSNIETESLIDGRMMMVNVRNNLRDRTNRLLKYLFDWCLTLAGTICIFPFLLIIGLWIRCDSPGPIIFKHRRVGKDGKEFYCYKFRTMCIDAQDKLEELLEADPKAKREWEEKYKLKRDPRVTRSGNFLRSTSLDELPQIFNVLKGEMSLVGPRPIVKEEIQYYGKYIDDYFMVRPGITGIWQTSGRSDTGYAQRVQMDTWYVRNWDFWFDVVLLWRTMKVVIQRKGAY